ncbi:hypothetical protein JXL21_15020 [Candidatus Bathyarchaeota archaeon]|nr:hypothetical protein [Candidatus Bathyarchaeota archaeon]
MPEVRGKLLKGETAELALDGDTITVSVQRGLVGRKMVPTAEIKLEQVQETELSKGHKPYTGSQRLRLSYTAEGEAKELTFFTVYEEQITEIQSSVQGEITRRKELVERQRREFRETRELHLGQLYLNLDLADNLFKLAAGTGGKINWPGLQEVLTQLKLVQRDREGLEPSQYSVSLDKLEAELRERHVGAVKKEVFGLLEIVLRGVAEASKHPSEWFDKRYHHLFVSTFYLLWEKELGGYSGIGEADAERLDMQMDVLVSLVNNEFEDSVIGGETPGRERLYGLAERLQEVEFKPRI